MGNLKISEKKLDSLLCAAIGTARHQPGFKGRTLNGRCRLKTDIVVPNPPPLKQMVKRIVGFITKKVVKKLLF